MKKSWLQIVKISLVHADSTHQFILFEFILVPENHILFIYFYACIQTRATNQPDVIYYQRESFLITTGWNKPHKVYIHHEGLVINLFFMNKQLSYIKMSAGWW